MSMVEIESGTQDRFSFCQKKTRIFNIVFFFLKILSIFLDEVVNYLLKVLKYIIINIQKLNYFVFRLQRCLN